MNMTDTPILLTIILVDDWYQEQGYRFIPILPGPETSFSDSEMLTLLLAMDYFPYPGERQFLGFMRANGSGHNSPLIGDPLLRLTLHFCLQIWRGLKTTQINGSPGLQV